jgi:hypothetical protein
MMAGLPFSSGAVAKGMIKEATGDGYTWLVTLLAIASVATTLLMTRFVFTCLALSRRASPAPFSAGAGIALVLLIVAHVALYQVEPLPTSSMQAIWPLAVAMVLAIVYALLPARAHKALQPVIPKGDLPNLIAKALLRQAGRYPIKPTFERLRERLLNNRTSSTARVEHEAGGTGRQSH